MKPTLTLNEALELCQKALSMMITPAQIDQTSTLQAFAIATEAEAKARAALSVPAEAVVGEPVAWTTQAQIDKFKVDPGCNAVMWGEPLPHHPDIPLYAAPSAPDGWQSIETVPRDGTPVILANFSAMCLLSGAPHVWTARWWADESMWAECSHAAMNENGEPTHWAPLPALGGASHE